MKLLNERLVALRQKSSLTQTTFSQALGLSLRGYRRYELGERDIPSSILIAIAEYFNVSLDYLVGRTDNPKINK